MNMKSRNPSSSTNDVPTLLFVEHKDSEASASQNCIENDITMINRCTSRRRMVRKNDFYHNGCSKSDSVTTVPVLKTEAPVPLSITIPDPTSNKLYSSNQSNDKSYHNHGSGNGAGSVLYGRAWNSFLRNHSKIQNIYRRSQPVICCASDIASQHTDHISPRTRSFRMNLPSWSIPSLTLQTTPSSLPSKDMSTTNSESEHGFDLTLKKNLKYVRFNEDKNVAIESEMTSIHIKENRKHLWWSNKDRIRSMKQRDSDIQQILKQNQIHRHTKPTCVSPSQQTTCTDTRNSSNKDLLVGSTSTTSLSEYCHAVVTLYNFCHDQCTRHDNIVQLTDSQLNNQNSSGKKQCKASSRIELTIDTGSSSSSSSSTSSTAVNKMDKTIRQALQIIAASRYRGLERIICKILQIQHQQHTQPPSQSMPTNELINHQINSKACDNITVNESMDNSTVTITMNDGTDTPAIEIADESTNNNENHNVHHRQDRPPTPHPEFEIEVPLQHVLSDITVEQTILPTAVAVVDNELSHKVSSSSSMCTTIHIASIRKRFFEYQEQIRRHVSHEIPDDNNCIKTNDENNSVDNNQPSSTKSNWMKTDDNSTKRSKSSIDRNYTIDDSMAQLLSNYYQSFLLHDISILWSQLIAFGDASTLKMKHNNVMN